MTQPLKSDSTQSNLRDAIDAAAVGDTVVVTYESSHGTRPTKTGTVTRAVFGNVTVDLHSETQSGEPQLVRVTAAGVVFSLTGGTKRRLSSGMGDYRKTTVTVYAGEDEP